MPKPTKPFEISYKVPRAGERPTRPLWAIPFDDEFREADILDVSQQGLEAYAALGAYVVENGDDFVPAYRVIGTMTPVDQKSVEFVRAWDASLTDNVFCITDRRSGKVIKLKYAYSVREAAICWFVRELGHEGSILCFDQKDGVWYVEMARPELILAVGNDGTEVPIDEATETLQYHTDKHPNAVMAYGE